MRKTRKSRYTESIKVSLTKEQKGKLIKVCDKIQMDLSVYGRKAMLISMKRGLVKEEE